MKTTREEINRLLSRLRDGNDCLKEFIEYSRGYMQYIAYKYSADKTNVDDALLSAYEKILNSIGSFDETKNGLAWMAKITQNEALKMNTKEKREVRIDDANENTRLISPNCDYDSLTKYDVERAMESLDERERKIVEYKVYLGMTVREISKETKIPKSTVSYIFKQALKKLEDKLK